jgi:hypothetical protein
MKLDIEDVELVEISASKIRSYFTGDGEIETIETGLDLVQWCSRKNMTRHISSSR